MAKSNPNKANQYQLDPRQKMCWDLYIDPNSPTFSNAYRSALTAGYEENTAAVITTLNWFQEKLRRLDLLEEAEKVLKEMIKMETKTSIIKGNKVVTNKDPQLVKIKQDTAKFLAKTLGRHIYSERQELTGKDGEALIITPEEKSKINNIIEEYLNGEN